MPPSLTNLPPEIHLLIATYLPLPCLNSLTQSSHYFYALLNPVLWSLMDPSTTLVWASSECSLPLVTYTLAHGADPSAVDESSLTALHWAAMLGHEEILTALIDAGANMYILSPENTTPLQMAVIGGHKNVAKLLLDNNACISGALIHACERGDIEMADLLLKNGASVDGDVLGNRTPLMVAVKSDRHELARMLYLWGADLGKKDAEGWRLEDLISMRGIKLGGDGLYG